MYLMFYITDINECLEQDFCGANSNCTNTGGSAFCSCLKGFEDIDGDCIGMVV